MTNREAKIQYVVRDFYTDIWKPFDTREEAEALRDKLNESCESGPGDGDWHTITIYDAANDKVIRNEFP